MAQSFNELKKVNHLFGAPSELYGESVSLYDTTGIIGSPGYAGGTHDEGSAFIISKNEGGLNLWDEVLQLFPTDPGMHKEFGKSVAIYGDYAVVGAPGDTTNGINSGSAYIFYRHAGGTNNWGQVKKLIASDVDTLDLFGTSVSIFEDYVAVGAMCNKDSGECSGSVYLFYKDFGGLDNWGEVTKVTASDGTKTDYFGFSVSLDSSILVVGAYEGKGIDTIPTGAAYIYYKNQGGADNWGEITKVLPTDIDTNDAFGSSVYLKNDTILVGAPEKDELSNPQAGAAYVFAKNQGGADNWGEVQKLLPSNPTIANRFGTSVAFDGNFMLVGTEGDSTIGFEAGAIYLFNKNVTWQLDKKIFSNDLATQDNFGHSVAIHKSYGLVGAHNKNDYGVNSGAAYVFIQNHEPIITAHNDTSICENNALTTTFKVTDVETSSTGIVLLKSSSNTSLVATSSIVISGADSNKTIVITPTTNVSGTTTITIVAQDSLNGRDTLSFVLTVNPTDSVNVNQTICHGDSLLFGSIYLKNEGVYKDTFQNQYGCDSIVELNLNVDTVVLDVTIMASKDSICNGENVTFTSNVTNPGATPMYGWYVNGVLQVISASYNTNTLSNGDSVYCVVTSSLACARPNPDTSNLIIITVFNDFTDTINDTICTGDFVNIGGVVYSSAGIYHDTLTSSAGCDSILYITITEYSPDTINMSNQLCSGDSLLFGGVYLKGAGSYSDTLKNQHGCDSIVNLELTIEPSTLSVAAHAVDTNTCPFDSVRMYPVLTGGGQNTTFIWRRNGTIISGDSNLVLPSSQVSSGDVYTVEVFSSSVCFTNMFAKSDTLQFTPRTNTFVDIYDTVCDGLGYSFGGQTLTVSGTYYDTTDASTFCDSVTTLYLVVYPTPLAPNIWQSNDTLKTDSWYTTYQWIRNGTPIPLADDSIYVTSINATYRVEVTDTNGCTILSYPWAYSPVGINKLDKQTIRLYPNPSINELNIEFTEEMDWSKTSVNLYDAAGKRFSFPSTVISNKMVLQLNNLASGTYMIEINNSKNTYRKMFLKQ